MLHISVPIANTMEYINDTEISPLISKGICKVCYVGQDPNRNHTVITKELARDLGRKLPGSPVVGYFDKETKDFDEHSRELVLRGGSFEIVDITRPYGFVPTNANVWFEKFNDEGVEHEYLVTEVYIWTGAYPESSRIIDKGNNQSMELTEEKGFWTNDNKTNARIFIYNEALIEKLCVLGENVEPCFEGAQIAKQFSLESSPEFQEFKATMFSMLNELQETLSKGGSQEQMEKEMLNPETEFQKKPEDEEKKNPPADGGEPEDKSADTPEEKGNESGKSADKPAEKKEEENEDKKKKYNLDEVVEYAELMAQYTELQSNYSSLENEVNSLRQFKLETNRKNKQAMIDSFYMLSDADKKDVVDHIDTYSLDDIEAKLSIICVRNKVNFNLESQKEQEDSNPQGLFNLKGAVESGDDAPAWIKAIRETAKKQ